MHRLRLVCVGTVLQGVPARGGHTRGAYLLTECAAVLGRLPSSCASVRTLSPRMDEMDEK
jgi:hypothetical protein